MKILALSGSLRAQSTNTALLHTLAQLAPDGVELHIHDYREVPLYDADLAEPRSVAALKDAVAGADAVIIATPEYNHSVPGVLKNALDWASRPAFRGPFTGKKVGIVSAAGGAIGGARAHLHLHNVLLSMGSEVYAGRPVTVGNARGKVADGEVTDEATREFMDRWLAAFVQWVG